MLANKLNYGDTIGVVGVSNSLKNSDKYEEFYKADQVRMEGMHSWRLPGGSDL